MDSGNLLMATLTVQLPRLRFSSPPALVGQLWLSTTFEQSSVCGVPASG